MTEIRLISGYCNIGMHKSCKQDPLVFHIDTRNVIGPSREIGAVEFHGQCTCSCHPQEADLASRIKKLEQAFVRLSSILPPPPHPGMLVTYFALTEDGIEVVIR